jgi:hypothetical protein
MQSAGLAVSFEAWKCSAHAEGRIQALLFRLRNLKLSFFLLFWQRKASLRSVRSSGMSRLHSRSLHRSLSAGLLVWRRNCLSAQVLRGTSTLLAAAERICADCVTASEFAVSLAESAVLFQDYQLRRAIDAAASTRGSTLAAAARLGRRAHNRALMARVLAVWDVGLLARAVLARAAALEARLTWSDAARLRTARAWAGGQLRLLAARALLAWGGGAAFARRRRAQLAAAWRRHSRRAAAAALWAFREAVAAACASRSLLLATA